jgi:hypothetical protein
MNLLKNEVMFMPKTVKKSIDSKVDKKGNYREGSKYSRGRNTNTVLKISLFVLQCATFVVSTLILVKLFSNRKNNHEILVIVKHF